MAKFVNISGEDVYHYYPEGHGSSVPVSAGQLVDAGDVDFEEQDDCYLVGSGDDVRAWPKSRWELQKTRGKADSKADSKSDSKPAPDKTESPAE